DEQSSPAAPHCGIRPTWYIEGRRRSVRRRPSNTFTRWSSRDHGGPLPRGSQLILGIFGFGRWFLGLGGWLVGLGRIGRLVHGSAGDGHGHGGVGVHALTRTRSLVDDRAFGGLVVLTFLELGVQPELLQRGPGVLLCHALQVGDGDLLRSGGNQQRDLAVGSDLGTGGRVGPYRAALGDLVVRPGVCGDVLETRLVQGVHGVGFTLTLNIRDFHIAGTTGDHQGDRVADRDLLPGFRVGLENGAFLGLLVGLLLGGDVFEPFALAGGSSFLLRDPDHVGSRGRRAVHVTPVDQPHAQHQRAALTDGEQKPQSGRARTTLLLAVAVTVVVVVVVVRLVIGRRHSSGGARGGHRHGAGLGGHPGHATLDVGAHLRGVLIPLFAVLG